MFDGVVLHHARCGEGREVSKVGEVGHCAIAVVDARSGAEGQAFLVGLPAQTGVSELIGDGLARGGSSGDRLDSIEVGESDKGSGDFIPGIDGGGFGVSAGAPDGADIAGVDGDGGVAAAVVGVRDPGGDVGRAGGVAPVRGVIAADSKVGASDDFEVIGEAGMADGEVVGGEVDAAGVDLAVQIRLVGVVDDLLVAVVFHHDQEDVIEMGDAAGMILLSESDGGQRHGEETQCCFPEHGFRTSPDWILGNTGHRGGSAAWAKGTVRRVR